MEDKIKVVSLEHEFIKSIIQQKLKVIVYFMNGYQMKGNIVNQGRDIILFLDDDKRKQQLIYKHAISTITPFDNVEYQKDEEKEEE